MYKTWYLFRESPVPGCIKAMPPPTPGSGSKEDGASSSGKVARQCTPQNPDEEISGWTKIVWQCTPSSQKIDS